MDALGVEGDLGNVDPLDCLAAIYHAAREELTGVRAGLQHMAATEIIPSAFAEVSKCLSKLPEVFDWMKRSAFRRGATTAMAMILSHFGESLGLPEVTQGWAYDGEGEIPVPDVQKLLDQAAPFAERILNAGDFTPFMATQRAPGDPEPKYVDLAVERPFHAACQGPITTHVVNAWVPKELEAAAGKELVTAATGDGGSSLPLIETGDVDAEREEGDVAASTEVTQ